MSPACAFEVLLRRIRLRWRKSVCGWTAVLVPEVVVAVQQWWVE